MALTKGTKLGTYEIRDLLGAGGMGVVYRARDIRLDRDVALKFLPDSLATDPDRLSRLRREAKILASLRHPGIAAIHGIEEVDGAVFLDLELVEGETLAARLSRGKLRARDCLEILRDVAIALSAAHDQGIVHRDLKPANLMIESNGAIRILDFGLARSFDARMRAGMSEDVTRTSTAFTAPGQIIGTLGYMSPEQVRGEPVDKRADTWSFGCILYECLAGKPALREATPTETIAAILKTEPDWNALPGELPAGILALLRRCLCKDVRKRHHDMADAALEIEEGLDALDRPGTMVHRPLAGRRRWAILALMGAGCLAAGFLGRGAFRTTASIPRDQKQFMITVPDGDELDVEFPEALALTRDGRRLVYVGRREDRRLLFLREMSAKEAFPLNGTDGASQPFFSPDGQWVGFFSGGMLKKVSVDRGVVLPICEVFTPRGGCWGTDDTIVFADKSDGSGLFLVPARGGSAQPVVTRRSDAPSARYAWPSFLPGNRALVAIEGTGFLFEPLSVVLIDLKSGDRQVLADGDLMPIYLPTGCIIFARGRSLVALPFDVQRLRPTGEPAVVTEELWASGLPQYAFSDDGTFVYVLEDEGSVSASVLPDRTPVAVSRQGQIEVLGAPYRSYTFPNLSPDGKYVAFSIIGEKSIENWIYALERRTLSRLTFTGNDHLPVWSPDGKRIAFSSDRAGTPNLYYMAADGSGVAERITSSEFHQCPSSWSADGRTLVYGEFRSDGNGDILYLHVEGDRQPRVFLQGPFDEKNGMLSPDGKWLAYTSNCSGRYEVYVEAFPGGGSRVQISTDGGTRPLWARDSRELFYWTGAKGTEQARKALVCVVATDIDTRSGLRVGRSHVLFEGAFKDHNAARSNYDISLDGQRFLMLTSGGVFIPPKEIHFVVNWQEGLASP